MFHSKHSDGFHGARHVHRLLTVLFIGVVHSQMACEPQSLSVHLPGAEQSLENCRARIDVGWILRARTYDVKYFGFDLGDHIGGRLERTEYFTYINEQGEECEPPYVDHRAREIYNHGTTAGYNGYLCPIESFGCSYWLDPQTDEELTERNRCTARDSCIDREVIDSYCDARCGNCDYDLPILNNWDGHNSNNDFDAAYLAFGFCRQYPYVYRAACDECSEGPKFKSVYASYNASCICEDQIGTGLCDAEVAQDYLHNYCDACGGDTPCQQCADMSTCSQPALDGSAVCCGGIG